MVVDMKASILLYIVDIEARILFHVVGIYLYKETVDPKLFVDVPAT